MFEFRYSYKYASFSASISKETNIAFSPKSSIKLDTGARNTKPLNINLISDEKDLAAYFRNYYKEDLK